MIAKPIQVTAIKKYSITIMYDDGTSGEIDLSHLSGKGVFKAWDKNDFFSKVYIDKQSKSISWNDIIQLCPNTLYFKLKKTSYAKWHTRKELHGAD